MQYLCLQSNKRYAKEYNNYLSYKKKRSVNEQSYRSHFLEFISCTRKGVVAGCYVACNEKKQAKNVNGCGNFPIAEYSSLYGMVLPFLARREVKLWRKKCECCILLGMLLSPSSFVIITSTICEGCVNLFSFLSVTRCLCQLVSSLSNFGVMELTTEKS